MRRTIGMGEQRRAKQSAAERRVTAERATAAEARADLDDGTPVRERHDGWTAARRQRFIEVLALVGNVRDACRAVGMSSVGAYRMRRRSKAFARDWETALARAATGLEAVAYARAVEGVEEPVYQGGKLVGVKRRYANDMLRLLLQAANPGKFGRMGAGGAASGRVLTADGKYASLKEIEAQAEARVQALIDAERAAAGNGALQRLTAKFDQMQARRLAGAAAEDFCATCGVLRNTGLRRKEGMAETV